MLVPRQHVTRKVGATNLQLVGSLEVAKTHPVPPQQARL